ncbi:MAG TPA: LUD domain-containing protein [Geminicoccus sp.]|uniref:LutC/YkgG family protein n=1 Tax=Geminicoccus sp. TaxID=2024832 RepID=UPI002E3254E5|nr:LUD domain-containing protein [Geminicoccus sp.]HEX2529411.1 LUD domain-containing protein [Geminicoccus sp.]
MTASSRGRDAILGRLREIYDRTPEREAEAIAAVEQRVFHPTPNLIPARGQLDLEGRIELFTTMARNVQAEVERLPTLGDVPGAVASFLRRHNLPQKIVAVPDPLLRRAGFERQPLLRVRFGDPEETDAVGLTLAFAGVAETGTLMLCSSPERPTLMAFLPENSLIVLPTAEIHGAYEQAWQRLRATFGSPPRSVNFVTGPSRTGDIAQKLELGAHGPRRLQVLLVDDLGPA